MAYCAVDQKITPSCVEEAWADFHRLAQGAELERPLVELVNIRVSQINCCANDLNKHSADAARMGETPQRLHLLAAWRHAPVFTDRERAALAWAERLTLAPAVRDDEEGVRLAREQFSAKELESLTFAIIATDGSNKACLGSDLFDPTAGWW